ncbi:Translocation protein sec63 [Leucoagaricus sp. SymC.cos]|nr:Translocation protein sec63 [Leucoagaricus sp. SymC.cos]
MANYHYDEGGSMAAYFLITILAMVLTPMTLSSAGKRPTRKQMTGCECKPCLEQRSRIAKREKGSLFVLRLSKRAYFLIAGWSLFAFLCYKVAGATVEGQVYNPFEILGISASASEKEIKSHYKKLSRLYHPDKVKPTVNDTIETIQDRFVKITKAYKSLTDETIRKNWELYGNPDGRQEMSMGIALPKWIVESHNNVWVLGFYGLLFGGALPALVGRWWFGNRQKTKDGVNAKSAAAFFKSLKEESPMEEVVGTLGKAFQYEMSDANVKKSDVTIDRLESEIEKRAGSKWTEVRKIAKDVDGKLHPKRRRALVLIYAHLLRIEIPDPKVQKEQIQVLLQLPLLLTALLNVSVSRSWLLPTLAIMRLHAYLAQALPPVDNQRMRLTQLPSIQSKDVEALTDAKTLTDVAEALESKKDGRASDIKKALEKWGTIDIVDVAFKVIGERVVTPSSIVFLVVKLRLIPPSKQIQRRELSVDETKKAVKSNDEKDEKFLTSRGEMEELDGEREIATVAHAPYWPSVRFPLLPSWWVILADDKLNRVVVPPFKVTDVPYANADAEHDRDYRSYKIQFQAPQNTGMFTWKIYLVSDTFVGGDVTKDIILKIEEPQAAEQVDEDEISDPDEDTLAGQMAAMRGGKVKKRVEQDEDDDESSTDDDQDDDGTSSDSDSD